MGELMQKQAIVEQVDLEKYMDKLPEDRKKRVMAVYSTIDIGDEESILNLGKEVSNNLNELNKTILKTVSLKDVPEIEAVMPQLREAFDEIDSSTLLAKKQGFFSKLFKKDQIRDFMSKFENAESVVANVQKNLQRVEIELRKDIEIEEWLGEKNLGYIDELQDTIAGMRMKLNESLAELHKREAEVFETDYVGLQVLEDFRDDIDSLDKQIFWLEQQKMLSIQTLPILRNLKVCNKDMVRQISLTIQQSIPAWEQGIIIAFHIHRQQGALRIERAVHEMTNQIVKQNSQLLKENSVEIMKAIQDGMIDMDTFREANNNLIEMSRKMTEVKINAMQNRKANIQEYRKLTEQLIEAEKRDLVALAGPKAALN